jgi:nucleotide-binding universal stress UspA family protein
MLGTILVPLDGSELAEHAVEWLKRGLDGCKFRRVVLLRALEPAELIYSAGGVEAYVELQKRALIEAREYLARMEASLLKHGLRAKAVLVDGVAEEEILNYARRHRVSLIVMSTHGRSGVSRWLTGSVTDRVVTHSPAPVLVVPPPGARGGQRRRTTPK